MKNFFNSGVRCEILAKAPSQHALQEGVSVSAMFRIVIIAVFAAAMLPACAPVRAQDYARDDLLLFKEKCTQCHKMKKIFKPSSPVYEGKQEKIVNEMQKKAARKKGKKPISDAEKAIIISLFDSGTPEALKAALEQLDPAAIGEYSHKDTGNGDDGTEDAAQADPGRTPGAAAYSGHTEHEGDHEQEHEEEHEEEGVIEALETIHGPWQMLAFPFLGLDMGQAAFHFQVGTAVAALFIVGGLIGLQLAAGRAGGLKWLHITCNSLATLLFICNIVTGFRMFLG